MDFLNERYYNDYMGWRINKSLGWVYKYNPQQFDSRLCSNLLSELTLGDFKKFLKSKNSEQALTELRIEMVNSQTKFKLNSTLDSIIKIIVNFETDTNLLLFSSIMCHKDWHRNDDAMDYLEKTQNSDGGRLKVNYIRGLEVFPYIQPMIVTHNLKKLTLLQKDQLRTLSNKSFQSFTKSFQNEITQNLKLDPSKDFRSQLHMSAPELIEEMFNFIHHKMKIKSHNYLAMRPAIVTYWS